MTKDEGVEEEAKWENIKLCRKSVKPSLFLLVLLLLHQVLGNIVAVLDAGFSLTPPRV